MANSIDCGFGILSAEKYPIITLTAKSTPPKVDEINFFIQEFIKIIQRTSGKFLLIIDSAELSKISRDSRESLAIGLQFIEGEFKDRYVRNIFVINKIPLIIILQLVKIVVRPVVRQKLFLDKNKALSYANELMAKLSTQ